MNSSDTALHDNAADTRWQALRLIMRAHDHTPATLARLIGASTPNAFYNFLNRRSNSLSYVTLEKTARALSVSVEELCGATPFDAGAWRNKRARAHNADEGQAIPDKLHDPLLLPVRRMDEKLDRRHVNLERRVAEARLEITDISTRLDRWDHRSEHVEWRLDLFPANDD